MSISNRVQKLEDLLVAGSRLIVCSQPRDMSDHDMAQYLKSHGIPAATGDLVVSLKRFSDAHPEPWIRMDAAQA